jgi:putative transposase
VLTNHIHLVTEADSRLAHIRGVQGFEVRFTRNVNRMMKRNGKLVAHRYHVRELKTPTEVRLALRYVLQNRKHHAAEKKFSRTWFDPWSSAAWFDGWATPLYDDVGWKYELLKMERPTACATTWLLKSGWKRLGLLRLDEAPSTASS